MISVVEVYLTTTFNTYLGLNYYPQWKMKVKNRHTWNHHSYLTGHVGRMDDEYVVVEFCRLDR